MDIGRLLVALPRKIGPQSRLLFRDPKRFIENLDDLIHPERLQQKMLGLEEMRPMHVRIDGGNTATPHLNVLLPGLGATPEWRNEHRDQYRYPHGGGRDTGAPPRDG